MTIVVLSGGTGTPKLIQGFDSIKDNLDEDIAIISNTGDDWDFYGLHVSPDVDAVLYLLSGKLDTQKFWGIVNDTFFGIGSLKELGEDIWFNLGDQDLGFCLYRTHLLKQGATMTQVTENLRKKLGISFKFKILPMSDQSVQTYFNTPKGRFHLEEYFIKHKCQFPIDSIEYEGSDVATVPTEIINIFRKCSLLIIGPSNPISSIGPILYPAMKKEIKALNCPKIVVSPIIGESAVSGPTNQFMLSQGLKPSPQGILEFYKEIADHFIFHYTDESEKLRNEYPGKEITFSNILFNDINTIVDLVKDILKKRTNFKVH